VIQGLTVHLVTPRTDPLQPGLSELYARIKATKPKRKETRHLMESDLQLMSRAWSHGLRTMAAMGCIEWRVSHDLADLPPR
jgi:hypothetical protein